MKRWLTKLFRALSWSRRTPKHDQPGTFTRQQLENAQRLGYDLGYNDGKRDGLAIARQQATKSLKEILWQQNQSNQSK